MSIPAKSAIDEFLRALGLFPVDQHQRLIDLEHYLRNCDCDACRRIGDDVRAAFEAARYDETSAADERLDTAERLAVEHGVHRRSSDDPGRSRGQATRWATRSGPPVAATNAS
ncbi:MULTISPECIES: hypothetical protein [unclassified Micromonospora]|uniref:hypothetical protein n=1 Tax=unclassified Micromonospora TaxID=2617518 RepID=UPI0036378185